MLRAPWPQLPFAGCPSFPPLHWRTLPSSQGPSLPTLFPPPRGPRAQWGGGGGPSKQLLGPDPHLGPLGLVSCNAKWRFSLWMTWFFFLGCAQSHPDKESHPNFPHVQSMEYMRNMQINPKKQEKTTKMQLNKRNRTCGTCGRSVRETFVKENQDGWLCKGWL